MEYLLVLLWFVAVAAVGLLALPLAAALFDPLPGRGAVFAAPLGLAGLLAVALWVGHLRLGYAALTAGLLAVGCGSFLALRRGVRVAPRRYGEWLVVFAVAFGFVVAVRATNPVIRGGGGEMFLDFGLLKTLLRTDALPPEDIWFAGEPVQYYYGGHLLTAQLARLTGTPARYAYNLGLAAFYGLLVAGAYGVAGTAAAVRHGDRQVGGVLGAFFVGVASTAVSPLRLLVGEFRAVQSALDVVANPTRPVVAEQYSIWHAAHFAFTNTDFPLYSVYIGSLHGHVMSTPFLLLTAALLFAYYRTPPTHLRARWGRLAAAGVVVGLLGFVNTWSLPTGVGLSWLALTFARGHPLTLVPARVRGALRLPADPDAAGPLWRELGRPLAALAGAAGVAGWALAATAPFVLATNVSRGVGLWPDRSGVGYFLVGYGAFLAVTTAYLWPRVRPGRERRTLLAALALAAVVGWYHHVLALPFVVPVVAVGWYLLRRDRDVGYETLLAVAAAGLVFVVEFAYVKGGAEAGRFNTVYKVFTQVWVLWGVATGAALGRYVTVPSDALPAVTARLRPSSRVRAGLAVVLVVSLSAYGVQAAPAHFSSDYAGYRTDGDPTLDGLAYAEEVHPDHAAAIEWLDDREGQPHVVAAPALEQYMYQFTANPASSLTGLPTVAGWNHAKDYHSRSAYYRRADHVRAIYTGTDAVQARYLRQYDVDYVYLSPTERSRYDVSSLAADPGISRAFTSGEVMVFSVNQSALVGA